MSKPIALTMAVKSQWKSYWSNRPDEEPMTVAELVDTLREVTPVPPERVGRCSDEGLSYFVHDEFPDMTFVATENGVERKFIAFRPYRIKKTPAPTAPAAEPPRYGEVRTWLESLPPEPPGLTKPERQAWLSARKSELKKALVGLNGTLAVTIGQMIGAVEEDLKPINRELISGGPVSAKKRTDIQRGEDREFGRIQNLIVQCIEATESAEGRAALSVLMDAVRKQRHRPDADRRIGGSFNPFTKPNHAEAT